MWFGLSPLALSGFIDVFGRQPSNCGWILMVAPDLSDRMLTEKRSPHMSVQTLVVEMMISHETSDTHKAKTITFILERAEKSQENTAICN